MFQSQKDRELTLKRVKAEAEKRATKPAPENIKIAVNDRGVMTITVDLNRVNKEALPLSNKGISYLVASTRGNIRVKKEGYEHMVIGMNVFIPVDEYTLPENLTPKKEDPKKPSQVVVTKNPIISKLAELDEDKLSKLEKLLALL